MRYLIFFLPILLLAQTFSLIAEPRSSQSSSVDSKLSELPSKTTRKILCLGDSLTEGYGLAKEESYPAQLAELLKKNGFKDLQIVNGGISGSTTASSLRRLKWHLRSKDKPHIVILALGANDGLRGQDVENSRKNLEKTIELAQKNSITILLAGMKMPPNYGAKYTREFAAIFPTLARKYKLALIPFLLEGVAGKPELNLPDGIHPNGKGYALVAQTVMKHLKPLLEKK